MPSPLSKKSFQRLVVSGALLLALSSALLVAGIALQLYGNSNGFVSIVLGTSVVALVGAIACLGTGWVKGVRHDGSRAPRNHPQS